MARRRESGPRAHDETLLMIPPPGFKFIPRYETVCGQPGCFECFDIYCERCESKDRRIIELEMRNNDLAKYIAQLQARVFGSPKQLAATAAAAGPPGVPLPGGAAQTPQSATLLTPQQVMQNSAQTNAAQLRFPQPDKPQPGITQT
ncbi:hypothetical protein, conserved [Eimeria maxima]|uniref:Uncharacterized protein n=1 Tax=Eimeria maxima TaxID=5804 RepID=U6M2E7_EIMMA|nr:hypothetical protein, conserved [Eimeria maxima]CDJ56589.1 hypothetical protein, conserved [Eimeria maxima]